MYCVLFMFICVIKVAIMMMLFISLSLWLASIQYVIILSFNRRVN